MTRWPDFFVVGAEKAGTTTLDAWLRRHPGIAMPRIKEPDLFRAASWPPGGPELRAYQALFPATQGHLRGEASPGYLVHPAAPSRINSVAPDARIIMSLREPVARAWSAYLHRLRRRSRVPFEHLVEQGEANGVASVDIFRGSLYADAVERYLGAFPGRVLVIESAALAADPAGAWHRICEFLEVDAIELPASELAQRRNTYRMPRSRFARRILLDEPLARRVKRLVPTRLLAPVVGPLLWDTKKPRLDADLQARCAALFRDDVACTRAITGHPLPSLSPPSQPDVSTPHSR